MKCNSIKQNVNKVCIGNLNKKIKIQTSSIAPNNSPNSLATASFETVATVWAMLKTSPNRSFIDGVNVANGLNTDFFIRYTSSIDFDKQLWIEWNNTRFKIINPDNIDKEDNFIRLRCVEKGDKTILANAR
jgi:SPP1 family predicted phage head-tail adaptor